MKNTAIAILTLLLLLALKVILIKFHEVETLKKAVDVQKYSIQLLENHNDSLSIKLDWYHGRYYVNYNDFK